MTGELFTVETPLAFALLGIRSAERDGGPVRCRGIVFVCGCTGFWFPDGVFVLNGDCGRAGHRRR